MIYTPSQKTLERYADVLVNYALGGGKGIKKGEVVRISASESAKPLFIELRKAVLRSGGHILSNYQPTDSKVFSPSKDFFDCAQEHHFSYFPKKYLRGMAEEIDHSITIISTENKKALEGVDPKKIVTLGQTIKPFRDWLTKKEIEGKFSWTIALYGTQAMATEANLPLEEYWGQIQKACFLDKKDPKYEWREAANKLEVIRKSLNALTIEKLHIKGTDVDLWIKLGKNRQWIKSNGQNIPSFELFTSPDWRGTEGWMKFNQPLYRYDSLVTGIELEFKKGIVVNAKADKNEKLLREMIASVNADKVGEFSLTDKRFSRITKFMAETLFDENIGGRNGNTHIALGMAYKECFKGNAKKLKPTDWKKNGFNDSPVHTDIVSTSPRTVTAHLKNGKERVVYSNGEFNV